MVYDAEQRRRFGMFTMKKGALVSMGFFIVQALMVLAATNPYKLCFNRSVRARFGLWMHGDAG